MNGNILPDISEALQDIDDSIRELQEQKALILGLDLTERVTEEKWHEICETPLRSSDLMGIFLRNIFPDAENILIHCNYVYFDLRGFRIQIPTSREQGINVYLDWYHNYRDKEGWRKLAKLRLDLPAIVRPFAWWLKYRWKDPNREQWEAKFKKTEEEYQERQKTFFKNKQTEEDRVKILFTELLPVLNQFSSKHYRFNSAGYGLEDVLRHYPEYSQSSSPLQEREKI